MERRDFLLLPLAAPIAAHGASDNIATAFIGTGNRGSYLLKSTIALPGARVAAVCDLKPDRLDNAATLAARDKPATFADYRRLLESKDIDAVFIATPCDLHAEMAIAALQAGKHVYCEKPAGIEPRSIARLVKAVKSSGRVFQIGQQMRAEARLRRTIEMIHDGVAGKVIMAKAQRHAGDDLDHNGPSKDWFFNAARSGDVIVEMAVHNLDECNWAVGSRPERACGVGGTLVWKDDPPGRTNMDGYTVNYEYANGVEATFTQTFFHPNGMPGGGQSLYIYGTQGGVDVGNSTYYARERRAAPKVLVEREPQPQGERRDVHIAAFLDCIRTGAKPFADIEVAATAALTAIMGREAIRQKRVITWNEMGVEL